jgi:hypothetical protein
MFRPANFESEGILNKSLSANLNTTQVIYLAACRKKTAAVSNNPLIGKVTLIIQPIYG